MNSENYFTNEFINMTIDTTIKVCENDGIPFTEEDKMKMKNIFNILNDFQNTYDSKEKFEKNIDLLIEEVFIK